MVQCKTYLIINSIGEVNIESTTTQLILGVITENNMCLCSVISKEGKKKKKPGLHFETNSSFKNKITYTFKTAKVVPRKLNFPAFNHNPEYQWQSRIF